MENKIKALEQRTTIIEEDQRDFRKSLASVVKSDTEQKSSLKAIHKRLNEDAAIRLETHDEVKSQTASLKNHIEWEEKEAQIKKDLALKEDKRSSKRFVITTSILSVIAAGFLAVSGWLFLTVLSTSDTAEKNKTGLEAIPGQIEFAILKSTKEINHATVEASKKNYRALKKEIKKLSPLPGS